MLQVTNDNDVIAENEVTNSDGEVEETSNSRPESPELLIKHPLQVIFDRITWIKIFTKISTEPITVRTPIVHRATIFLQNFLVGLLIEFFLIQDPSDTLFTK